MLRDRFKNGFSERAWNEAKHEARAAMIERAKVRSTLSYSDLVRQIVSVRLEAHDARLSQLLGEISSEEDAAGRGMLTVVVVHKHGDMQPGPGFFELAQRLGRKPIDPVQCWIDELKKVYDVWFEASGSAIVGKRK